jgi:peptide/nickel transport system substrate-binding protein
MVESDNSDRFMRPNRRDVLATIAGVGGVGLAGCMGGQTASQGGPNAGGDGSGFSWVYYTDWNPTSANVIPYSVNTNTPWFMRPLWGNMTVVMNLDITPIKYMVKSVEQADDGTSTTLTFKDGYTFWDGTPVTAKDLLIARKMYNFQTHYQEFGPKRKAKIVQDSPPKIKFTSDCPVNPTLALLRQRFNTAFLKHDYMSDILKQYRNASGEAEINDITQKLNNITLSIQEMVDKNLACGLWKPTDWDTSHITHKKVKDHPLAEKTNIDKFTVSLLNSNQKITQAVSNNEVDSGSLGDISGTSIPGDMETIHQVETGAQINLRLNYRNKHLKKQAVRRALAYVINYKEIVKALKSGIGVKAKSVKQQNMASPLIEEKYLPDGFNDKLIDYGQKARTDKAAKLLTGAGYSKKGGVWTDSSGSPIRLTHITPKWNSYKFVSDYLSSKLKKFGIKTNVLALSSSGFQNKWRNTFDFDMATWFQSGMFPSEWYNLAKNGKGYAEFRGNTSNLIKNSDAPKGCTYKNPPKLTQKRGKRLHQPVRPKFPAKVGAHSMNISGKAQTLKPFSYVNKMTRTQSEKKLADLTSNFAWYANWSMPSISLFNELFAHYGDTKNFSYPSKDDPEYNQRNIWEWAAGADIQAKNK